MVSPVVIGLIVLVLFCFVCAMLYFTGALASVGGDTFKPPANPLYTTPPAGPATPGSGTGTPGSDSGAAAGVGKTYTKHANYDIAGNDVACYENKTADYCKTNCDADANCQGYNDVGKGKGGWPNSSGCCVKKVNGPLNYVAGIDFYAIGTATLNKAPVSTTIPATSPSGKTYTKYADHDVGGSDIQCFDKGETADFIKGKCDANTNCKGYNVIAKGGVWGDKSGGCIKTINGVLLDVKGIDFYSVGAAAVAAPGMKGVAGSAAGNISVLDGTPCTNPVEPDSYAEKWRHDTQGKCTFLEKCKDPYTVSGNKCITQAAMISKISELNKDFAGYDPRIQKYIFQNNIPAEQDEALKNVPQSHWPGAALYLASFYYDQNGNPKEDKVGILSFQKLLKTRDARIADMKGETATRGQGIKDMVLNANKAAIDEKARKELALYEDQKKSIDTDGSDVRFPVINANTNNVGLYSPDGNREFGFNINSGVVYISKSAKAGGGVPERYVFDVNRLMATGRNPMGYQEYSFWIKPDGRIVTKTYDGSRELTDLFSSKAPGGVGPFQFTVDNSSGNLMVSRKYEKAEPVQFN
jgi:hypothetical protein